MGFMVAVPGTAVLELYANGDFEAQGAFFACGVIVAGSATKAASGTHEHKIVT